MYFADAVLRDLRRDTERERIVSPERWLLDPPPSQRQLRIDDMSLTIRFDTAPAAAHVALSLERVDREARRIAAAMERGVPVKRLRGRGVRLISTHQGLRVEQATPGSLNLELLFGGLYTIVTSQPLSFALNLSALLGYGKAVIHAILPGGREKSTEIMVEDDTRSRHERAGAPVGHTVLSTPHGLASFPIGPEGVIVHIKDADGTEIYYDSRA